MSTYYTSKEEIEKLFSVEAVDERLNDYDPLSTEYDEIVEEIVISAHYEVKSIINKLYEDFVAINHPWIRRRATYIGAYYLSIRRGNDSQYYNEYIDALNDLESLINGERYLEDLTSRVSSQAAYLNVSSDNRYPFSPMRVDPLSAIPNTDGVRFVHRYLPFSWL